MSKILILGGAGFIGSNLSRALVAKGVRPRIFTRPSSTICSIEDILPQVDLAYGNFGDDVVLQNATKGVDTVFHLISTTFPSMTVETSFHDVLSNLLPTIRLLEACIAHGVKKIVYASSGGTVYGEPVTIPITENHPLIPKSAYGQSKLTIEGYLASYARTANLCVDILRISNPYGPGRNPFRVQGLVAAAMCCASSGRVLQIYGTGDAIRDYIYIDDVTDAMLKAANMSGSFTVNISSGEGHSVLEIVNAVEKISGRSIHREFIPARKDDVRVNILSNRRAYEIYRWRPKVSLDVGLTKTWEWLSKKLS